MYFRDREGRGRRSDREGVGEEGAVMWSEIGRGTTPT